MIGQNQVWATDISYIPMDRGFVYVVAIMDWYSRKVLTWQVSTRWMQTSVWMRWTKPSAAMGHGTPDIFNTDQDAQFTSDAFTGILKAAGIQIAPSGTPLVASDEAARSVV